MDVISVAEVTPDDISDWKYEVANGDTMLGLAEWLVHQREAKRTHVEVYEWKENETTGYLDKVRTKTVGEVYDELRAIVGEYPDGGEEYFSIAPGLERDAEWPNVPGDRIVCFSVNGSSEGNYVHCEIHRNGSRELIFLGKTFMGRDASWAFARRLADLLEIQ